jgi:hypothetical protein
MDQLDALSKSLISYEDEFDSMMQDVGVEAITQAYTETKPTGPPKNKNWQKYRRSKSDVSAEGQESYFREADEIINKNLTTPSKKMPPSNLDYNIISKQSDQSRDDNDTDDEVHVFDEKDDDIFASDDDNFIQLV